jgi:hypothetical protein
MRSYLLMGVAGIVLAGCAGGPSGQAPSLTYDYVEAKEVPFSEPPPPPGPVPLGGVATEAPPPEKRWKSASAKISDAVKKSKRNALDCSFEGSIMTCPFRNGLRYQVTVDGASHEGAQDSNDTQFWLEPGEGAPEIIFGNPAYFTGEVTAGGVDTTSMRAKRDKAHGRKTVGSRLIIAVKNYKPGERTSMTIVTGNRVYLYDLIVPSCGQPEDETAKKCNAPYNPVVQHTYDSDQPQVRAAVALSRDMPAVSDTRYSYDGPAEFLPKEWSAYNDGVNTYVLPPARLASRPVPFLPKGSAPSFSVDPQSRHYVIRGLPGEILFTRGDITMTVRRER